jgi:hypothetical protein
MPSTSLNEKSFIIVLFGFILVWILAAMWIKFFNNLFYRTLGIDEQSSLQTFLVALFMTIIFLILVFTIGRPEARELEKDIGSGEE